MIQVLVDATTYERTDGHNDHYIPPHFCGGYNKSLSYDPSAP